MSEITVTAVYYWKRQPGEEIPLYVTGTHTPAGQMTEYDQPHGASTVLNYIERYGEPLAESNFTPEELEEMRQCLINEVDRLAALLAKFANICNLLNLPKPSTFLM